MTPQGTAFEWAVYRTMSEFWTWLEPVIASHAAVKPADPGLGLVFLGQCSAVWLLVAVLQILKM